MITLELAFFALATLFCLVGGVATIASKSPIRSAMGLLTTILGVAAMYLLLSAEFLAAVQVLVYAGAVVVLFVFVIMLLGSSAVAGRDARTAIPRYFAAILFGLVAVATAALLVGNTHGQTTALLPAPNGFGHIEPIGAELFTVKLIPFEIVGALLLVAVVAAVAVARGKQLDPTMLSAEDAKKVPLAGAPPQHPFNPDAAAAHATTPAAAPHGKEAA